MRPGSLFCLVICKWIELIFLMLLTGFLITSCAQMIIKLNGDAVYLTVLSILACVLSGFNLFYNNLFMNLRFRQKKDCQTFGVLFYDLPNLIFCHFCCNKLCRDRCPTLATTFKWIFKTAYLVIVIGLIKDYKRKNPQLNAYDS